MSDSGSVKVVSDLQQIKVLADPLRQKILSAFVREPRTTKQAAEFLGMKPTGLYHHVDLLERHGFLRLVETRPKRGTVEKYFQATATRFEVRTSGDCGDGLDVIRSAMNQVLADASASGGETMAATGLVYLSEEEVVEIRGKLLEVLSQRKDCEGERRAYRMLAMLVPASGESE